MNIKSRWNQTFFKDPKQNYVYFKTIKIPGWFNLKIKLNSTQFQDWIIVILIKIHIVDSNILKSLDLNVEYLKHDYVYKYMSESLLTKKKKKSTSFYNLHCLEILRILKDLKYKKPLYENF